MTQEEEIAALNHRVSALQVTVGTLVTVIRQISPGGIDAARREAQFIADGVNDPAAKEIWAHIISMLDVTPPSKQTKSRPRLKVITNEPEGE